MADLWKDFPRLDGEAFRDFERRAGFGPGAEIPVVPLHEEDDDLFLGIKKMSWTVPMSRYALYGPCDHVTDRQRCVLSLGHEHRHVMVDLPKPPPWHWRLRSWLSDTVWAVRYRVGCWLIGETPDDR